MNHTRCTPDATGRHSGGQSVEWCCAGGLAKEQAAGDWRHGSSNRGSGT